MRLLKIGRDAACDIVLQSPKVSSLHAEITLLNNGDILLEDKHSRNGTFVMNRPIQPGTQVSIKRGDAIRFGDVELMWNQVPMPEDLSQYKAVYGIGSSMRNDINIAGDTVSRYHATLKIDKKGKAYLEDHSKNGCTVNGNRLMNGQVREVKRGDSIACGGVPVDLSRYVPSKTSWGLIIGIVAAACIIGFGIWGFIAFSNWNNNPDEEIAVITPATPQALENASANVYGGYYYEVTIKDDPLKNNAVFADWPQKFYISISREGRMYVSSNTDDIPPIEYNGTAFFISKDGEMGTNRHIAVPWKYISPEVEEAIRQAIAQYVTQDEIVNRLQFYEDMGWLSPADKYAWLLRLQKSDIEIGGKHAFLGVGLTGSRVGNLLDLNQAQVIAESEDPKKDVAILRLNTRKTPQYIVDMGAIYDLSEAVMDEQGLKVQEEELTIVGYPLGDLISDQLFDGQELRPTIHSTKLSRIPDDNQLQIQTTGIGGMSGSPISDSQHRLVGILCSGFEGTDVAYGCNAKHLVELYNKHRVRE